MEVLDVFGTCIDIMPSIPNILLHIIHLIINVFYWLLPINLPFVIKKRRRLWKWLSLVVNIATKGRILEEVPILVINIAKIFLIDSIIQSILSHVWIISSHVKICNSSVGSILRYSCTNHLCPCSDHSIPHVGLVELVLVLPFIIEVAS